MSLSLGLYCLWKAATVDIYSVPQISVSRSAFHFLAVFYSFFFGVVDPDPNEYGYFNPVNLNPDPVNLNPGPVNLNPEPQAWFQGNIVDKEGQNTIIFHYWWRL